MIFEKGHFKSSRLQKSFINESLNKTQTFSAKTAYDAKTTVFLSHKHKDLEELEEATGVIELLEDLGVKVYIDSLDNKMPDQTTGETAARIKEIIKSLPSDKNTEPNGIVIFSSNCSLISC